MAWHNEPVAPWQTPEWIAQMRPNAQITGVSLTEYIASLNPSALR